MTEPRDTVTLTTAKSLSAFANPARSRIIDALNVDGPSTASMLADRLGIAVGSVSHHLKVLADAELVAEAPELARDKRERWWQTPSRVRWSRSEFADDHAAVAAADTVEELNAARQADRVREWLSRSDPTGPWASAAFCATGWMHLSPAELREFAADILAVHEKWAAGEKDRVAEAKPERTSVFVIARGFPSQP